MNKESIRCWKVGKNNEFFITYPEGDKGHRLICCKKCGEIYAVNVIKQLYMEPDLDKHLANIKCLKCNSDLANQWLPYPDKYIEKDGSIGTFERPSVIPSGDNSIIVEFFEVFS